MHQVSADFDQGMSGGPTVNSRGEVYGINSQMTVPFFGQNFNVITDTAMLSEFLGQQAAQPEVAQSETAQPQATQPGQVQPEAPAANAPAEPTRRVSAAAEHADSPEQGPPAALPYLLVGLGGVGLGGGLATWRLKRSTRSTTSAVKTESSS